MADQDIVRTKEQIAEDERRSKRAAELARKAAAEQEAAEAPAKEPANAAKKK